ncbi:MAG: protein-export chaperone SecB [Bacillaceae bacterium]|nr:protein-export chaperone SecB [Bacillaceae bacterium]
MEKPVISFEQYEILNINYEKLENSEHDEQNIDTSVSIGFTEDMQAGKVEIEVKVFDPELFRKITVSLRGLFTISEGLSEEEIKMYLAQNGTAILYPYVRSIVSFISSLDSESAIVLPTINTLKR